MTPSRRADACRGTFPVYPAAGKVLGGSSVAGVVIVRLEGYRETSSAESENVRGTFKWFNSQEGYEETTNKGKMSAENLKVQRQFRVDASKGYLARKSIRRCRAWTTADVRTLKTKAKTGNKSGQNRPNPKGNGGSDAAESV